MRNDVLTTLRSHGIPTPTAQAILTLADELRAQTQRTGEEFAALLEASTGRRVGPIVHGRSDEVLVGGQWQLMQPGRRYVHVHTHPHPSGSFSDTDVGNLVAYEGLQSLVVVGVDGTWYVVSKEAGRPLVTREQAENAWALASVVLISKYERLRRSAAVDADAAWRLQTHEVLQGIAPRLGLRYDRVEPR